MYWLNVLLYGIDLDTVRNAIDNRARVVPLLAVVIGNALHTISIFLGQDTCCTRHLRAHSRHRWQWHNYYTDGYHAGR